MLLKRICIELHCEDDEPNHELLQAISEKAIERCNLVFEVKKDLQYEGVCYVVKENLPTGLIKHQLMHINQDISVVIKGP